MSAAFLSLKNVSKAYAGHQALDRVSLEIPPGCIFGLLGPNGAGKTSLIRIINQITAPDSGELLIKGRPMTRSDVSGIGYLPEERGLYRKMAVGEQLVYLGQLKGLKKQEVIQRCKFWFERFDIGDWWHKKLESLSKGMQQKVQFIATVLHQPELLILDEPFSGFDPINAAVVREEMLRLRDAGTTILFSTHRMEAAEALCDEIGLIHQSKLILSGSVSDIIKSYKEHLYEVVCSNHLSIEFPGARIISVKQQDDRFQIRFQLSGQRSNNDLLSHLIQHTEVFGFSEVLPSLDAIFIQAVQENA
jgi:ABC-2 type transport system ATP-binding protein